MNKFFKRLALLLAVLMIVSMMPVQLFADNSVITYVNNGTENGEDGTTTTEVASYVTVELEFGSNVSAEDIVAAKALYEGKKFDTCKAANEAYMALFGVTWGKGYLDVTDNSAPLYKYAGVSGSVAEVKYYIHGTLAGFTSLQSNGNNIDCSVGGNHQIARTSISIIGVNDENGGKAKLTDGNIQAYVAGGYISSFTASGKLTIDNIEFTSTTSTTVGASAAKDANSTQEVTSAEMEIKNCKFNGRLYVYDNFDNAGVMTYNIHDNVFDGANYNGDSNAYAIFAQCKGGNKLIIADNKISGFARGINIDHANVNATISGNTISIKDAGRSCIQLSRLANVAIADNTLELTGGNAITLHELLLGMPTVPEITVKGNTITGNGYLIYDGAAAKSKAFTSENLTLAIGTNTVASTVDTTQGVYDGNKYGLSETVATVVNKALTPAYVATVNGVGYTSLAEAIAAAPRKATVKLLADTKENVTISTPDVTLDLNGFTLNGGTEKGKPALTITARVTVMDSSEAQTGTIMREDTAENSGVSSHYVIDIQGKNALLTFNSGNVRNNSGNAAGKGASLVRVGNDSDKKAHSVLTIAGGTFTQDNFIVIKVDFGTLHLKGGTVSSKNSYAVENWLNANIKENAVVNGAVSSWTYSGGFNSTLTISGGTVNGDVESVSYDGAEGKLAKVAITGGTVNGTLSTKRYSSATEPSKEMATIEITGGTFTKDPSKYVVEGSAITDNGDGTFGVAKAYLAEVDGNKYYTMDEAFHAAVAAGSTLKLLRNYTTASSQNSGSKSFTIDLNGFTWTYTSTDFDCAAFEINYPNVTLTVKNGTVVSASMAGLIPSAMSGTITYDNSGLVFDGVEITANGNSGIETNGNNTNDTVTLKNSTLNVPNGFGIYFPSSGTLTVENSKIIAKTMGVQVCSGVLIISGVDTAITVTGDAVPKTENDGAIQDGAAISIVNRTGYKGLDTVTISGGKFTAKEGNSAIKAYDWANKTESNFTASEKVAFSGGTFSSEVKEDLCADCFIPTKNADGTYGVKAGKYVAQIGDVKYETLAEAIAAANAGDTVTLLAEVTADVVIDKNITLDLGGKTLTNTGAGKATISVTGGTVTVKNGTVIGGTSYYNIEVTKGSNANLTLEDITATAGNTGSSMIDNWGTMTIKSGTYTGGMNTVKSEEGSTLVINGGKFELNYAVSNKYNGVILSAGITTISGGEFIQNATTPRWGNPQVVLAMQVDGYTSKIEITGGTFTNKKSGSNIFHGVGKATSDNFEVSGGTFNKSISDSYCAEGFIPTKNADGTYGVKEGKYVAKVGSTGYETLDEAIAAANKSSNSKTIKLLENLTVDHQIVINNVKDKAITLDLGGKTLTSTLDFNGYSLRTETKVTIKNGTYKGTGTARGIGAYADFVLDGVTVDVAGLVGVACSTGGKTYAIKNSVVKAGYAVCNFADNATITISDSTLTGTGNVLYHNGSNYGLKLTVTNSTIIGTSDDCCGVYISGSTSAQANSENQNGAGGYQQATFTKCTISGTNGIEVKYTDLTLDGCTVISTSNVAPSYTQNNNGPAASGFAVVSTDNATQGNTPKPEGTIIVKGEGKYTGPVGLGSLESVKTSYAGFNDETIKVSDGTFSSAVPEEYCAEGFIPTKNADGTYGVKAGKYVAKIGDVKYETLEEAFAAAKNGDTITLLQDCKSDRINLEDKSVTVVLNGKTLTSTAAYGVMFCAKNGNKITIDGTVEGSKLVGTLMITSGTDGHIEVNGGTYESSQYCPIYVNGAVSSENSTVTVKNAIIKATNISSDQDMGCGVYLAGYSTSVFENCTITAPITGIEIRAGKLTLNNCNVTGGNGEVTEDANGNGTTVTNAALAISQHTTKKPIEVTIDGGTFNGTAAVYQTDVQGTGSADVKIAVKSGTFNGTISGETDGTIAISGGKFKVKVDDKYFDGDYACSTDMTDGYYTVAGHPIISAGLTISVDMSFRVKVRSGYKNGSLRYYYDTIGENNTIVRVEGEGILGATDAEGNSIFRIYNVNPQRADLVYTFQYYDAEGNAVGTPKQRSVIAYFEDFYNLPLGDKEDLNAKKTFIANFLEYCASAMERSYYLHKDVTLNGKTWQDRADAVREMMTRLGLVATNYEFKGNLGRYYKDNSEGIILKRGVVFGSTFKAYYQISKEAIDDNGYRVFRQGMDVTDKLELVDGAYRLYFELAPYEFKDNLTITVNNGTTKVCEYTSPLANTLEVLSKSTDASLAKMAKAAFNYFVALQNYNG